VSKTITALTSLSHVIIILKNGARSWKF